MNPHPCLSCGACCAYYRVSFSASEMAIDSFEVPADLVLEVTRDERVMLGTHVLESTRCTALSGVVGKDAHCSIYSNRPSPCRKFEASYAYGVKEPKCDEARQSHGLPPLTLQDYDLYRNQSPHSRKL